MQVKKKLLDLVRDKIRFKHYSYSTERTYVHWIKHYIFFHNKKHPVDMSEWNIQALRAQERKHVPVVLTKEQRRHHVHPQTLGRNIKVAS
jgi:hypothetical protein